MIEGLALARRQGVVAELVIAGDGPDLRALQEAADRAGLGAQVTFAGPAFGERKIGLLGAADALILPELPRRPAVRPARRHGRRPRAGRDARVGAIPDVMVEGLHGVLIPARDPQAIARAIVAPPPTARASRA